MARRISRIIASWFYLVIIDERQDDALKLAMVGYCDKTSGALHSFSQNMLRQRR